MAKGKFQRWLEPHGLTLLEGWARDGLTDVQIADKLKITVSTLYEWKKRFPTFSEALKKGKEIVDYEVENALLKRALSGDVTAQIFWLKNRRPDKWRDKQDNLMALKDAADDPITQSLKEEASFGAVE